MKKSPISFFVLLLSVIVIHSFCKVSKNNYSYGLSVELYKNNILVKEIQWPNHLLIYNNYLFEFNIAISNKESYHQSSKIHTIETKYDTLGVYVLSPNERKFFEFDTFATTNKLITYNLFSKKPFGQKMYDSVLKSSYNKNQNLSDTTIWGHHLYYFKHTQKNKQEKDSIISFLYLLKKPGFLSLLEVTNGAYYPDRNYCLIGFSILDIKSNELLLCKLEDLRRLSREEEQICASMIKKVKKNH